LTKISLALIRFFLLLPPKKIYSMQWGKKYCEILYKDIMGVFLLMGRQDQGKPTPWWDKIRG
jgi:hypothetical protein